MRLYQAGCLEKLIKEVTGHKSDTVREYQRTPNNFKRAVSETLSKAPCKFKALKIAQTDSKPLGFDPMLLEDSIKAAGNKELSEIMKGVDKSRVKKVSVQIDVE